MEGMHPLAQQIVEEGRNIAHVYGFQFWFAQKTILRGRILAQYGREEEGIEQIQQGLRANQATGAAHRCSGILSRHFKRLAV